jgi:hypothetical protein
MRMLGMLRVRSGNKLSWDDSILDFMALAEAFTISATESMNSHPNNDPPSSAH